MLTTFGAGAPLHETREGAATGNRSRRQPPSTQHQPYPGKRVPIVINDHLTKNMSIVAETSRERENVPRFQGKGF